MITQVDVQQIIKDNWERTPASARPTPEGNASTYIILLLAAGAGAGAGTGQASQHGELQGEHGHHQQRPRC
jgi:hypothetical protein